MKEAVPENMKAAVPEKKMFDQEKRRRRDYLRRNKDCEYCAAMGGKRTATVVVPRRIGEQEYYVALCEEHWERIKEIEGEG